MLAGNGTLEAAGDRLLCQPGRHLDYPSGNPRVQLPSSREDPLAQILRPDLDKDFRQPLARRGLSSAEIDQIVFD